ncbi:hypothetical protein CF336_g8063 [Tilletia laevis]|nr:hypothetical protein CF336_g8063 [Tilletia laevis]
MLDDHETVLRDQKRLEERLNPDPLTASFEDRAERLSLDFEEASCHYANCEESEDCYACGRQRNGRCEEHDSSKPWEEAADAKEDLYHAAHELKSVIIDWSKHLISQLADPSSRTVETCSNVLDGVMDMIEHWGYAAEADCVQNQDTIIWPEKEPWPKPGDDDEDSDWDIPAIICRLCRDVLLCILAIEHSLPASDSATPSDMARKRKQGNGVSAGGGSSSSSSSSRAVSSRAAKVAAKRTPDRSSRPAQTLKSRWSIEKSKRTTQSTSEGSDSDSVRSGWRSKSESGSGSDSDGDDSSENESEDEAAMESPRKKQRVSIEHQHQHQHQHQQQQQYQQQQEQEQEQQLSQKKQRNNRSPSAPAPLHHPLALSRYHDLPPELRKYFRGRHDLFSLYDSGISLDATSWFSVTPESIAARIAERCRSHTILDAFGGAGGNAIQFAKVCERVVAVEIDPVKVEMARHNARIYGVEERITFVTGDVREFAEAHRRARLDGAGSKEGGERQLDPRWQGAELLDFDVIFLSPPWGGPTYVQPIQPSGSSHRSNPTKTLPGLPQDPKKLNARNRRQQRRAEQKVQGEEGHVGSVSNGMDADQSADGLDAALAAQLGLPVAFTGRFLEVDNNEVDEEVGAGGEDGGGGGYDADVLVLEEEEEGEVVGDITVTPWVNPVGTNGATHGTAPELAFTNTYSLTRLEPIPGPELFALARSLCASSPSSTATTTTDAERPGPGPAAALASTGGTNIALYLPRNVDLDEIAALVRTPVRPTDENEDEDDVDSVSEASSSSEANPQTKYEQGPVHLEECWLNGRLKAVCAYFGELASAWDPERDGWTG